MTDINELRRVLFIDRETSICSPDGERIDEDAVFFSIAVCNSDRLDDLGQTDQTCVDDTSRILRRICAQPELLGSMWLADGKVEFPYERKLESALEALYERKQRTKGKNKMLAMIVRLQDDLKAGKCKLREGVVIPDKFKVINNVFHSTIVDFAKAIRDSDTYSSEELHAFFSWLNANLVYSVFVD